MYKVVTFIIGVNVLLSFCFAMGEIPSNEAFLPVISPEDAIEHQKSKIYAFTLVTSENEYMLPADHYGIKHKDYECLFQIRYFAGTQAISLRLNFYNTSKNPITIKASSFIVRDSERYQWKRILPAYAIAANLEKMGYAQDKAMEIANARQLVAANAPVNVSTTGYSHTTGLGMVMPYNAVNYSGLTYSDSTSTYTKGDVGSSLMDLSYAMDQRSQQKTVDYLQRLNDWLRKVALPDVLVVDPDTKIYGIYIFECGPDIQYKNIRIINKDLGIQMSYLKPELIPEFLYAIDWYK